MPTAAGTQSPSLPAELQVSHPPAHAVAQHTPVTQKPVPHSVLLVHAAPFAFVHTPSKPGAAHVCPSGQLDERQHTPSVHVSPTAQLDVVVLTSLSEGQPLVILEAYAAGLPVVATYVGACRELIEGGDEADRALGPSGIVTRVANPAETAAVEADPIRSPV